MVSSISPDIIFGVGVIAAALVVVYLFIRATNPTKKREEVDIDEQQSKEDIDPLNLRLDIEKDRVKLPTPGKTLDDKDVDRARSNLRTLTLKQELLSMVMKRLFEAEDEGEITRSERIRLAKDYEQEMKEVQEELKRSELIVSLNELESIREDIIKKFESTLSSTQKRIDLIIRELDIEEPVDKEPKKSKPKPKPKPKPEAIPKRKPKTSPEEIEKEIEKEQEAEDEIEEEEAEEEEEEEESEKISDVDERLNKLKQEVMKELEELDRLEIEA